MESERRRVTEATGDPRYYNYNLAISLRFQDEE